MLQSTVNLPLAKLLNQAREVTVVIDGAAYRLNHVAPPSWQSSTSAHEAAGNTFRCSGQVWTLHYANKRALLPNAVGFRYIHRLLRSQGLPVESSRLFLEAHGEPVDCRREDELLGDDTSGSFTTSESRDEVLPPAVRRRLKDEISTLREEANALRESGDGDGASANEDEIEKIEAYLKSNTFRGRSATFTNRNSRDRNSVSNAIRRAIVKVGKSLPSLAWHLSKSIKTGYQCSYEPEKPTEWDL